MDFVCLLTRFIQNKVNFIFNSKIYQVPMITESWVTQNRVNSNSPEYNDPVPPVVMHVLTAASAEPFITTVILSRVSSLPSHNDLRSQSLCAQVHIFSPFYCILNNYTHLILTMVWKANDDASGIKKKHMQVTITKKILF